MGAITCRSWGHSRLSTYFSGVAESLSPDVPLFDKILQSCMYMERLFVSLLDWEACIGAQPVPSFAGINPTISIPTEYLDIHYICHSIKQCTHHNICHAPAMNTYRRSQLKMSALENRKTVSPCPSLRSMFPGFLTCLPNLPALFTAAFYQLIPT